MNEETIVLRTPEADDLPEIIQLLKISLGEGIIPRDEDFWRWKHQQNIFGPSPAVVAQAGPKIIGLRTFIRWQWRSNQDDVRAVRAVDTVVDPKWRGKKIFSRLTIELMNQMKAEGVHFIFNTPNKSSLPGYRKLGWVIVGRIPLWIRPLKLFRIASSFFKKGPRQSTTELEDYSEITELFKQPGLETFLQNLMVSERRYHTVRTIEYLRWRYGTIAGFTYHAKWRLEKQDGAVLIFRKRIRRDLQELSISEILVSPGKTGIEIAVSLLRELVALCNADYVIATARAATPELAVFRRSRFLPFGAVGPVFTVRVLNEPQNLPDPSVWSNWRCSIGDIEIF